MGIISAVYIATTYIILSVYLGILVSNAVIPYLHSIVFMCIIFMTLLVMINAEDNHP